LYTTLLIVQKTAFSILLICTTKIDTTNRIIAIVNEATWRCKGVHAKANNNFIESKLSSNRIVFFSVESPSTTLNCHISISW